MGNLCICENSIGLINASATFQRSMDVAFSNFIDLILAIYQDDLTTHIKKEKYHCSHLEKIFFIALEYDISLNPKKCAFGVKEGKFLGHINSKDGVKIGPQCAAEIDKILRPRNVKGIQYFFKKINFMRRFIKNFVEIVRPISKMLKKGKKVAWTRESTKAFQSIKDAIKEVSMLKCLDFSKPFQLFTFASFHTVVGV